MTLEELLPYLAAVAVVVIFWVWQRSTRSDYLALVEGQAGLSDDRLVGAWKSDRELTVREWRERRPMTDEQCERLQTVFGNLIVIWAEGIYTCEIDGSRLKEPYRVIGKDATSVVIRVRHPNGSEEQFSHLHFVGPDVYWLYAAGGPLREYFRRLPA